MCHVEEETKFLQKISMATICQCQTPLRHARYRYTTPCSACAQCGKDYRTLFLPCCCGCRGSQHDLPAAPRSQQPTALVSFARTPTFCLPSRPLLLSNANQHPSARILVSLLLVLILCIFSFPASWVGAEETHGVQQLSTLAFSSLEAAQAHTLHSPLSI